MFGSLELCRHFLYGFAKLNHCYPHLFRCSTIILRVSTLVENPLLPCFLITFSLFSFQGTSPARPQKTNPSSLCVETRSQNTIPCVLRSNLNGGLVGPSGLEPPTLRLSVVRSSQLSYGPSSAWTALRSLRRSAFRLSDENPLAPSRFLFASQTLSLVCSASLRGWGYVWWR